MKRPTEVTLSKKEQKAILSMFKKGTKNARTISDTLHTNRHQTMFFLEEQGLRSYSDGSYM